MPLDYTIPLKAQAPQTNPLQTMLQAAQFRYMNANSQAMQQQLDANTATSRAYQAATDPTTGVVDNNKLIAALSQDPAAAYNLGTVIQGINTQKQQQQTYERGQIGLNNDQRQNYADSMKFLTQQFATVDPTKPDAQGKFLRIAGDAIEQGHVSPQMVKATIAQMPDDPAQFGPWFQKKLASFKDVAGQLETITPKPAAMSTGGGTTFVDANAVTNPAIVGTTLKNTLTPGERVAQVSTYNNGQPGTKSAAQLAVEQGNGDLVPGAGSAANGRYPNPANGGASGGFNPTAAPVGEPVAMEGSAKQWDADRANAGSVAGRVYQLQSALDALQKGDTGPGSAALNNAKSFLLARSDLANYLPGVDANKVQAYDEANKYLTQYASAKAGALGGGTDAKLATTLAGNASTHISNLAAQDVVKANIGLERMDKAMTDAFAATGLPANQYANWKLQWAGKVDPRVFISDVAPEKTMAAYKKMTPKEQAQYKQTYNWAVQNGYIEGVK